MDNGVLSANVTGGAREGLSERTMPFQTQELPEQSKREQQRA